MQNIKTLFRPDIYEVAESLYWGKVYWITGTIPAKSRTEVNDVRDPPSSGWTHCFLIDKGTKQVMLFCPYTLRNFNVSRSCLEVKSMKKDILYKPTDDPKRLGQFDPIGFKPFDDKTKQRIINTIRSSWSLFSKLNMPGANFDAAASVLKLLDLDVPIITHTSGETKITGGKEVDETGLKKPVKLNSVRGKVLAFFLPNPRSLREAMAEFGTSRSNILSHLYMLQKDHGIGYALANDAASITLPKNCDNPFC